MAYSFFEFDGSIVQFSFFFSSLIFIVTLYFPKEFQKYHRWLAFAKIALYAMQ